MVSNLTIYAIFCICVFNSKLNFYYFCFVFFSFYKRVLHFECSSLPFRYRITQRLFYSIPKIKSTTLIKNNLHYFNTANKLIIAKN